MRSWPLRTLAFLAQAPRDTVTMTPILSSDATLRLLGCFLSFTTDRETVKRNLAVAVELCAEVRCVEASLTKQAFATQQIFRKLAPHLGPEVTRKVPPQSAREMMSEFRSFLRKHKTYTFQPKGSEPAALAQERRFAAHPGGTGVGAGRRRHPAVLDAGRHARRGHAHVRADDGAPDRRQAKTAVESFENGQQAEILGKLAAVSADGKTWPLPGRIEQPGTPVRIAGGDADLEDGGTMSATTTTRDAGDATPSCRSSGWTRRRSWSIRTAARFTCSTRPPARIWELLATPRSLDELVGGARR